MNKTELRKPTSRRLDPKKATPKEDMPRCVGNPRTPHVGPQRDVSLNGFDNKWRCLGCHQIHVELVYKESGSLEPERHGSVGKFIPVSKDEIERRARAMKEIKAKYVKGGEYYERSLYSEAGWIVNKENAREASLLARQIPRDRSEDEGRYGNRVIMAYRAMVEARAKGEAK